MNPIQTIREALEAMSDGKYPETVKVALAALAELERTHFTSEDVADASAQGFRDGVASVAAEQGQEPVAWMYDWLPAGGPTAYDWISGSKAEVFAPENCYFNIRPLFAAAPVAQRPQEPDWKHPKIQALIGADARNRIVIDLIWRILKEPEGGWASAMDMEYWDSIHDAVQAAVMKAQQPQAEPLCEDEGCPHSGTKHVCISPPQAEVAPMSQPNRLIAYSAAAKLRGLGYQWDEEAEAWAPQQVESVPIATFDGVIPTAIRGYLRRCSSGGMSKKHIDIVQASVDEAERLGYFKLAIAEAILASRAAPQQAEAVPSDVVRLLQDASDWICEHVPIGTYAATTWAKRLQDAAIAAQGEKP